MLPLLRLGRATTLALSFRSGRSATLPRAFHEPVAYVALDPFDGLGQILCFGQCHRLVKLYESEH